MMGKQRGTDGAYVVIHQMGKVGSTSIREALNVHPQINTDRVANTHRLSVEHLGFATSTRQIMGRPLDQHHEEGLRVRRWMDESEAPIRLICPFREPVARTVSGFFYQLDTFARPLRLGTETTTQELLTAFYRGVHHLVPVTWFDEELFSPFGINVYAEPFDHDRGWVVRRAGRFEVLLLRSDVSDMVKAEAVAEFLQIEPFEIGRANTGEEVAHAELYKRFRAEATLDPRYLDWVYSTRFARHFFTAEAIAGFRERWLGRQRVAA